MFGHIAGMLFQSRVHGIGRALGPSKKMQRHGTMRWGDASGDIGDERWTGFVKVNFMRSMLLLLPREDTNVDSEQYKASARLSAPLNGAPYQATFESCILQSRAERKDMGWPDMFDVMGDMSSSHLATKLKAEDTVDDTIERGRQYFFTGQHKKNTEGEVSASSQRQPREMLFGEMANVN